MGVLSKSKKQTSPLFIWHPRVHFCLHNYLVHLWIYHIPNGKLIILYFYPNFVQSCAALSANAIHRCLTKYIIILFGCTYWFCEFIYVFTVKNVKLASKFCEPILVQIIAGGKYQTLQFSQYVHFWEPSKYTYS